MMHRLVALGVVGLVSAATQGQWCVPGGQVAVPGRMSCPPPVHRPVHRPVYQRTVWQPVQDNFLGAPSKAPRRVFGQDRNPLLVNQAVNITPPRVVPHAGAGSRGFVSNGYADGFAPQGSINQARARQFFDGSTLNLHGNVSAGDIDLALQLGTGFDQPLHHKDDLICKPIHPDFPIYGGVFPWWWGYGYGYGYDRYPIDGPVVIYSGQTQTTPEAPAAVEEVEELTPAQRGALLLRAGEVDQAIVLLRDYLSDASTDAEAMRLLAIALLMDHQMPEAASMMWYAYETDRSLAHRPIGEGNLEGNRELRRVLREAVTFAHKDDSAAGWLMVTVLMQAEGRDRPASNMLERAVEAGLGEHVARAFEAALD